MVQLINTPAHPPAADAPIGQRISADDLGPPPEVLPPEPHARLLTIGGLAFILLILLATTVTAALASSGVFAVLIVAAAVFVTLVIWNRPGARRTRLRRADPEEIGAVGGRFRDLRR